MSEQSSGFGEIPKISPAEKELEHKATFKKDSLCILVKSHKSIEVGIQNFDNSKMPTELRLATVENPSFDPSAGENRAIWDNILESLPEENISFEQFRDAMKETLETLFEGKAKASFPNEQYISYAIMCMNRDSLEPARNAGDDILQGVGRIFGFRKHNLQ